MQCLSYLLTDALAEPFVAAAAAAATAAAATALVDGGAIIALGGTT
jgi:hypothetical protein